MSTFDRSRLEDQELLRGCREHLADEARQLAAVLADLAEIDTRKLYRPAACSSLYAFCVQELGMSEDAASKRVQAARVVRKFPQILDAIAERRLTLTAVVFLAPHLTPENCAGLLSAAERKTCSEIRTLLAHRFPRPDVRTSIAQLAATTCSDEQVSKPVGVTNAGQSHPLTLDAPPAPHAPRAKLTTLAPGRYELRGTLSQEALDDARAILRFLGHDEGGGDLMTAIERALKLMHTECDRKRAATNKRPRRHRASGDTRHVPAAVKRAVRERDGGQCTFKSDSGKRCEERRHLQLDHVVPFARGGRSTVDNLRLRCRAHNELEAEQAYGAGFMAEKIAGAKAARAEARHDDEAALVSGLRNLGLTVAEAKEAARRCVEALPNAPIEKRMHHALKGLAPRSIRVSTSTLRGATS